MCFQGASVPDDVMALVNRFSCAQWHMKVHITFVSNKAASKEQHTASCTH